MTKKFRGLENKLKGVHIGDLLYMTTPNKDMIAGFVRNFSPTKVTLSHESPTNTISYGDLYPIRCTIGDRKYPLFIFNQYRIISLSKPTSE